jgi:hypothetical protein
MFKDSKVDTAFKQWLSHSNGHPKDDEEFYKFVLLSYDSDEKLDEVILRETDPQMSDDECSDIINRYQDLYAFCKYLKGMDACKAKR